MAGAMKTLALAIGISSLIPMSALAASSEYDVIDVGSDPTQDDGAITITEDDDSINLHMGGDPNHGIYHNPSQQNEYVYPPDGWHGRGWDRMGGGGYGQDSGSASSQRGRDGNGYYYDFGKGRGGYDREGMMRHPSQGYGQGRGMDDSYGHGRHGMGQGDHRMTGHHQDDYSDGGYCDDDQRYCN